MRGLRQSALAWLLGVSPRALRDIPDCPRNSDGTYDASKVIAWRFGKGATAAEADDDPLLSGSSSPNLERYRLARAIAAERENAIASGQLVSIDEFEAWWIAEVAAPMRRAVDALHARFGPDAAAIVESVIDRAESSVESRHDGK